MKKFLKFTFLAAVILYGAGNAAAQGIFFDPDPTDVTGPVRLYVDITSDQCQCPNIGEVTEEDPLYIWTWQPAETRPVLGTIDVSNGDWTSSNENLLMKQDESDPNLYYFDFLGASPAQFYNVDPGVFYENGIMFLIKKGDGSGDPEPKSADLNIIPEPVGCFEIICPFPTTFFDDEYFAVTYNNAIETNPLLQNMGPSEAIVSFRYRVNGGPLQTLQADGGDQDKFIMDFEGDGFFALDMIPREYFGLQEGEELTQITIRVTKTTSPPGIFSISSPLNVGCE
ncbi:MAG: hypothetical protein ABR572_08515 [Cryomorphaceae bacterium]